MEFYQLAGFFPYLPDREDTNILIVRIRVNRKEPLGIVSLESMVRNFFIHTIEKIVAQNPNRGFALLFDCSKASLANVDIDLAKFIITTLTKYYSGAISYVYVYELPWILNQIWRLIRSWLSEDARSLIRFINKSSIQEFIDPNHLPDYMGGMSSKEYRSIPKDTISLQEMIAKQKLIIANQNDRLLLLRHFEKLIEIK
ncbi:Dopamine beta-hydroxylase [Sarcoptes scabiei]|nr:motile sperm domain containing 2-like protein 1 [Sarcoptes scabiei]UXI21818.1 Dopamine beta-hydroxylase [Sarcoptes scabiei]